MAAVFLFLFLIIERVKVIQTFKHKNYLENCLAGGKLEKKKKTARKNRNEINEIIKATHLVGGLDRGFLLPLVKVLLVAPLGCNASLLEGRKE